ncbi:Rossmann-like and DUF2520 domain-containing protein [Sphingobacterium gobiense]|uniref:DUF2520 domain-containing protein n=1 Tax=Sphingobacterium gobiense TaxID=1382456 RepID=A0A2S9JI46_9SPHI|nr:Rossmann-like and DUF2520 domain-containing protein [Sphingobacterium gobiense]PRD52672.1 DUF2520 domain-containing protein [Sphingobacterium gobiense]
MNIVILGSGNIASHIGKAFHTLGHQILQVYSRNWANAHALASVLNADALDTIEEITDRADLYFIAVTDQAIQQVADQLPEPLHGIVVHCSGATDINILAGFPLHGVIYPVQGLSKDVTASLRDIPFGIEGSDQKIADSLLRLTRHISAKPFLCNTEQRLALHLAAVFANNFSNVLFQIAYEILKEQNLTFDLLKPIILETAQKVQKQIPKDVQTGPAKRRDMETIQKHLQFLMKTPHWLKIYQELTQEITRKKH